VTVEKGWTQKLPVAVASGLIDWLLKRPLPDAEHPSDLSYGEPAPEHPEPGPEDVPFDVKESAA
jgi:hypothetical protein